MLPRMGGLDATSGLRSRCYHGSVVSTLPRAVSMLPLAGDLDATSGLRSRCYHGSVVSTLPRAGGLDATAGW